MKRLSSSASGIVSAVLVVVGILLLVGEEIDVKTDEEILSYYADSGNRTAELVGFFLVTVGVFFFLWFLSTLRARLASVEPEARPLSSLAFGAGIAAAALLVGGASLFAGTSVTAEYVSRFEVEPNLVRFGFGVGYMLLLGSVLVNCVLVISTSVLALRTTVLPNWLGWVGFAVVALAVVEAFLFPVFAIPVWVLLVSVVLMTRTPNHEQQVDLRTPTRQRGQAEFAGPSASSTAEPFPKALQDHE